MAPRAVSVGVFEWVNFEPLLPEGWIGVQEVSLTLSTEAAFVSFMWCSIWQPYTLFTYQYLWKGNTRQCKTT